MKKPIASLLFLIGSVFLFAETGYRSFDWGDSMDYVENHAPGEKVELKQMEQQIEALGYKTKMLGKDTYIFYEFLEGMLVCIHYSIPKDSTPELYANIKNKTKITEIKMQSQQDSGKMIDSVVPEEQMQHYTKGYIAALLTLSIVFDGYPKNIKEGSSTISIYNYNDDTRIYIFENLFEGQTIVAYALYEQDY
jgi:hypothetical protein